MRLKNCYIIPLLMVALVVIIGACGSQKNTGKTRFWKAFNARYNTYYNGTLAYIDASLEKETGNKDNYTEMIPLYTVGNKASKEIGKSNYDKAIEKCEKAIDQNSIKTRPEWTKKRRKTDKDIEWLNRKEYNPMLWRAWLLMGKSQFFEGDFDAASATFSYVSRLYQTQPAIYGKSRAWLAKCYLQQDWLYDAEDVIRNISRDSIHWSARKEWNYTYADYYIHSGDYSKAIPYLEQVIKKEGRHKQKARECFLLGQLNAEIGNNKAAYKAFKRVTHMNPPYELEFNARIAMTEVMAAGQSKKMISRLKRMARNDNNKDYLDQVYYAIGNIYMLDKDTTKAIAAYEKGNAKATRSGVEKGVLLLRLGDIYWDMEKYSDASRCYDEAIGLLDKDRKDYKQLSDRSKKLDELVPYTEAIHLQDSLLELSTMSEKDRNSAIDRVIEQLKKKEKEEKDKEAEKAAQQTIQKNGGQQNNRQNTPTVNNTAQKNSAWYFYNMQAVTQGKQSFQKQWGKRDNTDHWNRINKTVVADETAFDEENLTDEQRDSIATAEKKAEEEEAKMDSAQNDPHKREYYMAQIPFDEDAKQACNVIIMDGLYNSGVIFKDKLENLKLSQKQFNRLATQYPEYEHMDDAYYHMFLLYSRMDEHAKAETYVDSLKAKYPDSKWTTLLTDPNFEENQRFGAHIEDSLYTATYEAFKGDRFQEIKTNATISEQRFPLGANRDKFIFIYGLSKLNNGDSDGCFEDMNKVVKEYPQSGLATMAGMIVNGVKEGKKLRGGKFDISDVWARRSAVLNDSDSIQAKKFTDDTNLDFVFMVAYQPDSVNENQLLYELAKYNFTSYLVRNFDLELEDQDGLHVMKVSGFNNYEECLEYAHQFYKQEGILKRLGKSRTYVISEKNRELLGVNYSYDDYDKFYTEHFKPFKNQNIERLFQPADEQQDLDDGGSMPGNLSPILQKQQAEAAEAANEDGIVLGDDAQPSAKTPVEDNIVIEDEKPTVKAPVEDNVIIEDEKPAVKAPVEDNIVIEDEKPVVKAPVEDNIIIEDEKPTTKPQTSEDNFTIEEEKSSTQPQTNEDEFTIDENTNATPQSNDDGIVIDEDDNNSNNNKKEKNTEGEDDDYIELDGF